MLGVSLFLGPIISPLKTAGNRLFRVATGAQLARTTAMTAFRATLCAHMGDEPQNDDAAAPPPPRPRIEKPPATEMKGALTGSGGLVRTRPDAQPPPPPEPKVDKPPATEKRGV
jgi:hypothetical protein